MASVNPFDLLADDDNDDPSRLIAVQQRKVAAKKPPATAAAPLASPAAKLPSKPVPPAQAVREARNSAAPPSRGGTGRGGIGRGRGGRGRGTAPNRVFENGNVNEFSRGYGGGVSEEGDMEKPSERARGGYGPSERGRGGYGSQRQSFRGGRRGGYGNGNGEGRADSERSPHRIYERRSGTGRGNGMKREGAGRGNWGTTNDDLIAQVTQEDATMDEKIATFKKQGGEDDGPQTEVNKEAQANEIEEKEPEDKEMTLEEYEKIKEEKRKALLAMKSEERKVETDKDFESMQQLSIKKENDPIFVKLGSDKDMGRRKDNTECEGRAKKSVSITQFLKPAEGERYYSPGGHGRGRGRGRGDRGHGSIQSDFGGGAVSSISALSIEDHGEFPTLGGK